jgi:hypothetical protein
MNVDDEKNLIKDSLRLARMNNLQCLLRNK